MARAGLRAAAFAAFISGSASAQTLNQSLRDAYTTNPSLALAATQYAAQQAQVDIARASGRPTINLKSSLARSQTMTLFNHWANSYQSEATFSQDLYSGGRVRAAIRSARARAEEARFDYVGQRQAIQIAVVSVYLNVLLSEESCRLQDQQVEALEEDVRASRAEEREGTATKTDTQQSLARLAGARADRIRASSNFQNAREQFRAVVGHYPHDLALPVLLPVVPTTLDAALNVARRDNPGLRSLAMAIQAAVADELGARSQRRPSVTLSAQVGYGRDADPSIPQRAGFHAAIGLTLTVPLYQGGRPGAEIRQAQDIVEMRRFEWQSQDDQVRADTFTDGATIHAADEHEVSALSEVNANREALKGVRLGEQFGDRTRLDILNAEQEMLESELALSQARAERYMSRVELLSVMGSLGELADQSSPSLSPPGQNPLPGAALPPETSRSEPSRSQPSQPILKLSFDLAELDTTSPHQTVREAAPAKREVAATDALQRPHGRLHYDLSGLA